MKKILFLFIPIFFGCYNMPGIVFQEAMNNQIPSQDHVDYSLWKTTKEFPESIIFIIADGTGIGQYTISYYSNGDFAPARFDHIGLVATHPNDGECSSTCKRVTDSAASGTALSSGFKTYNGAIGVDKETLPVKTMLEWAEEKGMLTGLVATSTVTHATPASFAAHIDYRNKETEIAQQYAHSDVDLILGGGKKYWPDSLISIYKNNGGEFIEDLNSPVRNGKKILGLFADGPLPKVHEGRNPTTTQMADYALNYLEKSPNGFFVMIEESQVDWGGHSNSAEYIQGEMKSLNDLVDFVLNYQENNPNVLVVLTADHECGGVAVHDGKHGNLDIHFTSNYHSANFVPIWATGPGAEVFDAFMDNTEIGKMLIKYIKK
jgi:alkaline phosphatase|tara:strand:+ start:720 stop:1847 length:1128 start_codon:yes stop_codon:yes gene_type:complete